MEASSDFLTPGAREAFNYLRLTFIKTLIFWHFDLKCYIWIEIDTSSYAIGRVLYQLTSRISPNRVVIKANLS